MSNYVLAWAMWHEAVKCLEVEQTRLLAAFLQSFLEVLQPLALFLAFTLSLTECDGG